MGIERKFNRLSGYDYSFPGLYFITINVCNRESVSGEIINNEIILNKYGEMVKRCWNELPVIIGSYKSAVSKFIHRNGRKEFRWQKSYHDRIIRDQNELDAIRKYIRQNPGKWWQRNTNYPPI